MKMPKERVCVFNRTRQSFLSLDTVVADGHFSRLRGLIGRRRLNPDEGMWVVPCQGIHTIGVFFPIDVVYLDSEGSVVHLIENLAPFRIAPLRRNAASVLELPPRTLYESQTRIADELVVCSAAELEHESLSSPPAARKLEKAPLEDGEPAAVLRWRLAKGSAESQR